MPSPLGVDTSLLGNQGGTEGSAALAPGNPLEPSGNEDPFAAIKLPEVDQDTFSATLKSHDQPLTFSDAMVDAKGRRGEAEKFARQFLGTPYVWGGASPGGFDCSGLVQYVWKKFGLNLPRVSQQQVNAGKRTDFASLKPMDLVLFNEGPKIGIGHVAFWLGNGTILEAPHTGAQVRIRKLGKGEAAFGVHLNVD